MDVTGIVTCSSNEASFADAGVAHVTAEEGDMGAVGNPMDLFNVATKDGIFVVMSTNGGYKNGPIL